VYQLSGVRENDKLLLEEEMVDFLVFTSIYIRERRQRERQREGDRDRERQNETD
jgi:hypothetical protein